MKFPIIKNEWWKTHIWDTAWHNAAADTCARALEERPRRTRASCPRKERADDGAAGAGDAGGAGGVRAAAAAGGGRGGARATGGGNRAALGAGTPRAEAPSRTAAGSRGAECLSRRPRPPNCRPRRRLRLLHPADRSTYNHLKIPSFYLVIWSGNRPNQ